MSLVNSLLSSRADVLSNPDAEKSPIGQGKDLNVDFAQMLQYLRQSQFSDENNHPEKEVINDSLSQDHPTNQEISIKNLLEFLETIEGQVAKDFGPKLDAVKVPPKTTVVKDLLAELVDALNMLEGKLGIALADSPKKTLSQKNLQVKNSEVHKLAVALEEVKPLFEHSIGETEPPKISDEIKELAGLEITNDAFIKGSKSYLTDPTQKQIDENFLPNTDLEFYVQPGMKSEYKNLSLQVLSSALSRLQTIFAKSSFVNGGDVEEAISLNNDTGKITKILEAFKGIDLGKIFSSLDPSSSAIDTGLDDDNNSAVDQLPAILNNLQSENVLHRPEQFKLSMRTSDVVFPFMSYDKSLPIKNFPIDLIDSETPLQLSTKPPVTNDLSGKSVIKEGSKLSEQSVKPGIISLDKKDAFASFESKKNIGTPLFSETVSTTVENKSVPSEMVSFYETDQPYMNNRLKGMAENFVPVVENVETYHPEDKKKWKLKSIEQEVISSTDEATVFLAGSIVEQPSKQMGRKSVEKAISMQPTQVVEKQPEQVVERSIQKVKIQEIKAAPKSLRNENQSIGRTDVIKSGEEAKTLKQTIGKRIQLDEETSASGKASTSDMASIKNKKHPLKVWPEVASLAASKSDQQILYEQGLKNKSFPHHNNSKEAFNDGDTNGVSKTKTPKLITEDFHEHKVEVSRKKMEVVDASRPSVMEKAEAKLSSFKNELTPSSFPEDKSQFEKDFSERVDKLHLIKNTLSSQKTPQSQIEKRFYIAPPKIKSLSIQKGKTLAKTVEIDFVARITQTFMFNQQEILSKKPPVETSILSSSASVSLDSTFSPQIANSSVGQSSLGQASGGSNALEKWADSHLDLSSRGWATNMAKTMVSALNRGQERLLLSLSPPSLGRVSIAFTSTRGALDVRIQAERKATIALLSDAEGKLTSSLENSGQRVNSLSFAEMNPGDRKFEFDGNHSSNNENKGKGKNDFLESEKSAKSAVEDESAEVSNKKIDDSLVNITV